MNLYRCLWLLFFTVLIVPHAIAVEKIQIVTTIPTLKEFVQAVGGGEEVNVLSLLKGGEDLHTYDPRPGDARAVYHANLLVKLGIGLDEWVDKVIEASGNRRLTLIEASQGVDIISSQGEHSSHVHGNPHIWHDPENAKAMVDNIYIAMTKAFPDKMRYFEENKNRYISRISALEKELDEVLSEVEDRKVATYHPGWAYLLRRFDLKEVFSIERMPGREPSARDIAKAIKTIRKEKVKVIIGEPDAPKKILDIISKETGAIVIILAPEIGSLPEARSYMEMMRHNIREIAKGLKR